MAICGFAMWRSSRIARADEWASAGTTEGFARAIRLEPNDPTLVAHAAILRNDNANDSGDSSAGVEEELEHAARVNPFDSAVLEALGFREEFRGNGDKAEAYFIRGGEVDHQFKPAWTLANYYYRTNRPEKGLPTIERILKLEPLGFDPGPVFELWWSQNAGDAGAAGGIPRLIPARGHRRVQYLAYLLRTHRVEAALEAWPEALAAADTGDPADTATLTGLVDFLNGAERTTEAAGVWNQLVERGFIHSGKLDAAKGKSIADPDFRFAAAGTGFGWSIGEVAGVYASRSTGGGMRFEMNGDEPQSFRILSTFAAVLPGMRYRLVWKSDGAGLNSARDPGFRFQVVVNKLAMPCPPLLGSKQAGCDFAMPAGAKGARVELVYARAEGTTRVSGVLQLESVQLELAK